MEPSLSVALFTHPSRYEQAQVLIRQLGLNHPIKLIVDVQSEGIWKTAKRAWLSYDKNVDYHMVIQDDILICEDFLALTPWILNHVPRGSTVSFCDNLPEMERLKERKINTSWLRVNKVTHAQCLIQPISQIKEWIDWCDYYVREEYYHDDGRLSIWLQKHNMYCWHTMPSLVEHDDKGSVRRRLTHPDEIIKNKKAPYQAYEFIGESNSPLDIDWSLGMINTPTYRRPKLSLEEAWAIGERDIVIDDSINHPVITREGRKIPYDEAIKRDRLIRGLKE